MPNGSARLVWLGDESVYSARWADDHQRLADYREVHLVLGQIIDKGMVPKRIRRRPEIESRFGRPASKKRVEEFFIDLAHGRSDRRDKRLRDPAIWMRVLRDGQFS